MQMIENRMVVDSEWDEIEYGVSNKRRLRDQRRIYDELEAEDNEDEFI